MLNVLVTGMNGQLGSEIRAIHNKYQDYNFLFTGLNDLNITDHKSVIDFIKKNKINIIINCAAYTDVEKAEREFELAERVNHLAVSNFARIAKEKDIKLIHISTDYVFDGKKNELYLESDIPNPKSIYGITKLKGEIALQKINPKNSIIIRTSWVYSQYGNNFVEKILSFSKTKDSINVISDQFGSPTNASDLSIVILNFLSGIKNENVEIFHYSNSNVCSWYDFAKEVVRLSRRKTRIKAVKSDFFEQKAKRPRFSALANTKIPKELNVKISWKKSLEKYIDANFR